MKPGRGGQVVKSPCFKNSSRVLCISTSFQVLAAPESWPNYIRHLLRCLISDPLKHPSLVVEMIFLKICTCFLLKFAANFLLF